MSGTLKVGGKTLATHNSNTNIAKIQLGSADDVVITDSAGNSILTENGSVVTLNNVDTATIGSNALVVDSSGKVGIGLSNPNGALTVKGAVASFPNIGDAVQVGATGGYASIEMSGSTGGLIDFNAGNGTDFKGRILYDINNDVLDFQVNSALRMRIDGGGKIGINRGTVANVAIVSQSAETYHLVLRDSGGTDKLLIENDGDIYNTNGGYYQISDIKNKENVVDANSQWDDIKNLRVVNFNFKEASGHSTHRQIGFIAQEVELVCEHCVKTQIDTDDEGNDLGTTTKSVATSIITIKAIKALQEAMERIESQQSQIDALTARIEALEAT